MVLAVDSSSCADDGNSSDAKTLYERRARARTCEGGSDTASNAARMTARCSAVSGVTGSGRYGVRLVKLVPRVMVVPVGLVTVSEYPDLELWCGLYTRRFRGQVILEVAMAQHSRCR